MTNKGLPELHQINTVLVVDDDDNWCFLTKIILEDCGVGKQILTAYNGLEAIEKLQAISASRQKLPELIILDIKMPVMDGFEFLDEIIKSKEFDLSSTKICIASSSFLKKDKERARLYPISGFITKPLTKEGLKNVLKWNLLQDFTSNP